MRLFETHSVGASTRTIRLAAGLALWTLCGAGVAGAQELSSDVAAAPRPLELLMQHRAQLDLSDMQIERLDRIRARLTSANEPLVRRMLTLRRQWQRQRLASAPDRTRLARIRSAAAPIHARIQSNNRRAMQAVNRLLTGEQRQRLRGIVEERRDVQTDPAFTAEPAAGAN